MTTTLLDSVWLTLCGIAVFLMQAGFLCLEAGSTRSKNRINITVKNLADIGISVLIFWAVGYGLMFGRSLQGVVGTDGFGVNFGEHADLWTVSFFFFQAMFCSTAVTILSGAVAERVSFKGYLAIAVLVSGIIYPVFGHWVWHGLDQGQSTGWLSARGFVDFAGSTAVHSIGGWCALATILIIGPRLGRFSAKREFEDMTSTDTPFAFLGTMLLWFGWFGFNGGSNLVFNGQVLNIITNTLMAGSAGMVTIMATMLIRKQPVKIKPTMNGVLAGLVAITSGCHVFSSGTALIVGAVGSLLMVMSEHWLEKWRIDDVVGAIPVHLVAGVWGTLAVGLFGNLSRLGTGIDRIAQIKAQTGGILACALWAFSISLFGLLILEKVIPLRVSRRDEFIGLNISEHGAKSDLNDVYQVMQHHAKTGNLHRRVKETSFTDAGRVGHWYNQVLNALETAVATNDAIVQTAADGIVTLTSVDLTIASANPAIVKLFGYSSESLIGQSIQQLFASSQVLTPTHLDQVVQTTQPWPMVGQRRNGQTFPLEITASEALVKAPEGSKKQHSIITLFLKDISAWQQAEAALVASRAQAQAKAADLEQALKTQAQLIQRERISGQEQLVAGVAHEINNPVSFIHGNLNHAQQYMKDLVCAMELYQKHHHELSAEVRSHLENQLEDLDLDFVLQDLPKLFTSMKVGTTRIRTIVEDLRTFSRHDETALKTVDLHTGLESTLTVLAHKLMATANRSEISIHRDYGDLPHVECYASSLNRAILNILNNAVEALNTQTEATLESDGDQAAPYISLKTYCEGDRAILSIRNNGPHIPETVRQKIFDPFFTTQPIGTGTGLGCTISYQVVVEQHHGQLSCHSEPGQGVTFKIELPLTQTLKPPSKTDRIIPNPLLPEFSPA